jgi:hypothetical protein
VKGCAMRIFLVVSMLCASGCVTATPEPVKPLPVSGLAICDETRDARAKVASDIGRTSDDALAVSAGTLVVLIDAGCAP